MPTHETPMGRPWRRVTRVQRPTVGQILAGVITVLVVSYGVLLRFDAITLKYGPVSWPPWLSAVQQTRAPASLLRPAGVTWEAVPTYPHRDGPPTHYASDPYTYLKYAREMRSFYAAHSREPLFPLVTKIFLYLLRNQDVAVSVASAAFSVLAIIATLALGWYVFSWRVGLGAALAIAVEYDVVSWGVAGLRDDAFVCAVVLSAYAMLRYARMPSTRNAVLVGLAGGLSCLVRVTALSFLLPGFAYLVSSGNVRWRERLKGVGLAAAIAAAIFAPFAINCWLTFGDPLYAINVHADVYRATEGQTLSNSQTASQYLGSHAIDRPIQTLDTFILGMTSYPFLNKWGGFAPWSVRLGPILSWASVVGLILFVGSPPGRLLVLVLAGSLVPYALTWKLIADWRFTEHAYPFFLIAACLAIDRLVSLAVPSRLSALVSSRPDWRRVAFWGSVVATIGLGLWIVLRVLPFLVVSEALAANESVTIEAGERDGAFFQEGWSSPRIEGAVTARLTRGDRSTVCFPLPRVAEYDLTIRLDPFPRPTTERAELLPAVRVFINDNLLATFGLQWNPERVGAYEIHVPRNVTKAGVNRLVIAPELKPGGPDRVRFWYVRIRPVAR